jgi:hypothetical protein
MELLRRFFRLSSARRRLFVRTGFLVFGFRLLLWVLPFKSLVRVANRTADGLAGAPDACSPEQVGWAVTAASTYVPGATCLAQALAGQWLLRRAAHPARLHLGVAKTKNGTLKAHAWLECNGRVVVGGEGLEHYSAFSLPAAGSVPDRQTGAKAPFS